MIHPNVKIIFIMTIILNKVMGSLLKYSKKITLCLMQETY